MAILNDRIKERRLATGKTLLEVAELLGVKEATMQRYESGSIKNIKHETIVAMADIFSCSPAYLMGWVDSPLCALAFASTSDEERILLSVYASLNKEGREEFLNFASYLSTKVFRIRTRISSL